MELRHLRYFVAVGEHESVRVASQRLYVTQPAISRQIQDLEEELRVALFERTPRGLKLTAAGALFLQEAKRMLEQLDAAAQSARMVAAGLEGRLRLGFVDNAGWDGIVPAIFRRFQQEAPKVSVELTPLYTPAQLQEMRAGTLDGGFVYLFEPLSEEFRVLPLQQHDVVLAVPASWDLPPGPVVAATLADKPFVTFRRNVYPKYYDQLIRACADAGLTMRVVQEVSTETSVLSLVSAGIGAAIVNAANQGRPPTLVQFRKLTDVSIPLPLTFACLAENTNPALERFRQMLDEERKLLADPARPGRE